MRWIIRHEILTNTFNIAKIVRLSIRGIYNNRGRLEGYGLDQTSMRMAFNFKTSLYSAIKRWRVDSMLELAMREATVFEI